MSTPDEILLAAAQKAGAASEIAEQWANGPENTTIPTGSGPLPTLAEFMRLNANELVSASQLAQQQAGIAETAAEISQLNAEIYPDVASGLAAVNNNDYFSVVSADSAQYFILYRKIADVAVQQKVYPSANIDSLSINSGKNYPLKAVARDGSISTGRSDLNNSLLDVRVIGARAGKLYRIEYIGNGIASSGTPNYQILFAEYEKSNYATSSATGREDAIVLGDIPATSIESGDIITRIFNSTRISGLSFIVTYKPSALPANGQVTLNSNALGSYSWVIDPSLYTPAQSAPDILSGVNAISINSGKAYPLKAIARDGVTSAARTEANNAIMDIKVIGARPGKLYRLEYIGNGATVAGSVNYQMLFSEYDKNSYATSSATGRLDVIKLGDIPATSIESGSVITRSFKSSIVPGLEFIVTYEPSKLPTNGQITLNTAGGLGYSWIIDENRYYPSSSGNAPISIDGSVLPLAYSVSGTTDRVVRVAFRLSDTRDMRLTFQKTGVNNIYNAIIVDVADHNGTPPTLERSWINISAGGSDWLGPYRVRAVNNGDGGTEAFTGGAHGFNGDQTGAATARLLALQIAVDGAIVSSGDYSGTCSQITMSFTNRVQAYNTKTTQREVLEESFTLQITNGGVQVNGSFKALEGIEVRRYYGLQCMSNGFQNSVHMVGSQQQARITPAASTDYTSGEFSTYPNVPLIAMRSVTGEFWMWLDKAYGLGANPVIDSIRPVAQYSQFLKAYHTLVWSASGLAMSAGQSRKWRGGYAWGQSIAAVSGSVDTALRYKDAKSSIYGLVTTAATSAEMTADPSDRNAPINYLSGSGDSYSAQTFGMTTTGYGLFTAKI